MNLDGNSANLAVATLTLAISRINLMSGTLFFAEGGPEESCQWTEAFCGVGASIMTDPLIKQSAEPTGKRGFSPAYCVSLVRGIDEIWDFHYA